jgi:hypothetical protein
MKLVLAIETSRGVRPAHIYLDCGDDWHVEKHDSHLLAEFCPGELPSIDREFIESRLLGRDFVAVFGRPIGPSQRQALERIERLSPAARSPRPRDWSEYHIVVDLEAERIRIAWRTDRRERTLRDTRLIIRNVLMQYAQLGTNEPLKSTDYYKVSKRRNQEGANECLRKAVGALRDWLSALDGRLRLGDAVVGRPRNGYCLRIRVKLILPWQDRDRARPTEYIDQVLGNRPADMSRK